MENSTSWKQIWVACMMSLVGVAIFLQQRTEVVGDDIISQLPDEILVSIIRRLSQKDARRTSLLSKRWRNLYKFVTRVEFTCHHLLGTHDYEFCNPHASDAILNSLHWIFRHIYSGYRIQRVHLCCCISEANEQFRTFIYSLQDLGVEEVSLRFACFSWDTNCLRFGRNSGSPVSFHLGHLDVLGSLGSLNLSSCLMVVPKLGFQLGSLHTLSLEHLQLLPGSVECILSSCLSLTRLTIDSCDCPSKISITAAAAAAPPDLPLKYLSVRYSKGLEELRLCANNLIFLYFAQGDMISIILDHVPHLKILHFRVIKSMSPVLWEYAKDLPNLKSLQFDTVGDFYQESSRLFRLGGEMFSKLRELELFVCCTTKINLRGSLTPVFQSCPLLHKFCLELFDLNYEEGPGQKSIIYHSALKKVEIRGVRGHRCEIDFALSILRSAVRLQQMRLICFPLRYTIVPDWITFTKKPNVERIQQQLKAQAISQNAHLIIRHMPTHQRQTPISPGYLDFHAKLFF